MMIIDLSRILNGKESSLSFDFEMPLEKETLLKNYNVDHASDLHVKGTITDVNEELLVQFTYKGKLQLKCDRCLEPFEYELEGEAFKEIKPESYSEKESEDDDFYYYEGEDLEISTLVLDDIVFNLPLQMVCNPDCKGLCPKCGANLNKQDCECEKESIDPRFEVLKGFFDKEEV